MKKELKVLLKILVKISHHFAGSISCKKGTDLTVCIAGRETVMNVLSVSQKSIVLFGMNKFRLFFV